MRYMKAFDVLNASHVAAKERAQSILDRQQLECIDKINMYDARGGSTLSEDELFDWFLTARTEQAIRTARAKGYVEVDYVLLEDIPTVRNQLGIIGSADVLSGLEPSRRGRKLLGRQAIGSAIDAVSFRKGISLGDPEVMMTEYEMDPENYVNRSADECLNALAYFVQGWDLFQADNGRPSA